VRRGGALPRLRPVSAREAVWCATLPLERPSVARSRWSWATPCTMRGPTCTSSRRVYIGIGFSMWSVCAARVFSLGVFVLTFVLSISICVGYEQSVKDSSYLHTGLHGRRHVCGETYTYRERGRARVTPGVCRERVESAKLYAGLRRAAVCGAGDCVRERVRPRGCGLGRLSAVRQGMAAGREKEGMTWRRSARKRGDQSTGAAAGERALLWHTRVCLLAGALLCPEHAVGSAARRTCLPSCTRGARSSALRSVSFCGVHRNSQP
jgi:hypothetical protein